MQACYQEVALVDNSVWLNAYNYQIRHDANYVKGLPVLQKVERCSDRLGQYLYVNVGATVSSKDPGAFTKKDVVSTAPKGNAHKFFDGADISRWNIEWKQVWLDYRRDEMSGPRTPEMFEAEKLLVRIRTAENEKLIATYDNTGMYCDHTVIVCCSYETLSGSNARTEFEGFVKSTMPLDLFYILSLLNSFLMSWVFQNKYATGALQGSYSDVWPQSVRSFPIRRINFTTPLAERERLREEGVRLYTLCLSEGNIDRVLGFVAHHLSAAPERSDVVHDLLAFQAEQMMEMNQEKQRLCKAFFTFLKDRNVDKDALKPKTALDKLWELETNDVSAHLKKNKMSLTAAELAEIEAQTHATLGELKPLLSRIQATDNLIDQIVYRLYGLTEEEIAIVEGTANP